MNIRLLSTGSSATSHDFNKLEVTIGSSRLNDIQLKMDKLERRHCRLSFNGGEWLLENLSKQTMRLRTNVLIEKKQKVLLQHQDVFFLDSTSSEGFEFFIQNEDWEFRQQVEKIITCSICMQIFFQPVSITVCLHTFCGGCLSKMVPKRCPMCRKMFVVAGPNFAIQQICDLLQTISPSLKRDKAETDLLDQNNRFKTWKSLTAPVKVESPSLIYAIARDSPFRLMPNLTITTLRPNQRQQTIDLTNDDST